MSDPFFEDLPRKTSSRHEIGQDLSTLSIEELDARVMVLKSEIDRLETERTKKHKAKSAAADVFKLG